MRVGYDRDRKRVRLTPHQKEVLGRLERLSRPARPAGYPWRESDDVVRLRWMEEYVKVHGRPERKWVSGRDVGAPAGCEHLVEKGFAERRVEYGPRGGEHLFYRPTGRGA